MAVIGTCKLCRATNVELRDSHLLPKAGYKILRGSQDGESPIMVDREIALMTDSQLRAHVLCGNCEDLFNKCGEQWVLRYCYRGAKGFRLRNLLETISPDHTSDKSKVYAGAKLPELAVDKLAYFAASVFWRSCIHDWRFGSGSPSRITLGQSYEREFREYLLHRSAFPQNAALWVQVTTDQLSGYISVPAGGRLENYWRYDFGFLGIGFTLSLGRLLPRSARRFCFVRSPEHVIATGSVVADLILSQAGKLFGNSKPVGSLAKSFLDQTSVW